LQAGNDFSEDSLYKINLIDNNMQRNNIENFSFGVMSLGLLLFGSWCLSNYYRTYRLFERKPQYAAMVQKAYHLREASSYLYTAMVDSSNYESHRNGLDANLERAAGILDNTQYGGRDVSRLRDSVPPSISNVEDRLRSLRSEIDNRRHYILEKIPDYAENQPRNAFVGTFCTLGGIGVLAHLANKRRRKQIT
jgi:hypothetical protein